MISRSHPNISALIACIVLAVFALSRPSLANEPENARTFVLVYAEHLEAAAREWAAYRSTPAGGAWRLITHAVAPAEDTAGQRQEIQRFIRQACDGKPPSDPSAFAVLLLGDADANGVPTWRFPQADPVLRSNKEADLVSDHPYQLIDDLNDSPDVPLGRVPAQNNREARVVLNKIKSYEAAPLSAANPAAGRNRIVYAAGEGHFGAMDSLLESLFKTMVDQLVPDAFDLSMTYAKATSAYCPPPSKLTETVLRGMSEGAILFNYIGHGHATGLDSLHWAGRRIPILNVRDMRRFPAHEAEISRQMPIAFLSCCSTGWFDLPRGEHCIAEAMLFHSFENEAETNEGSVLGGGPAAVIAGSRITHPYANTVLQMDITKALLVDRASTVGMLDFMATQSMLRIDQEDRDLDAIAAPIALAGKWKTSLMGLRQMHAKLYNLLGDPAMRISLPSQSIKDLIIENNRITGRVEGMSSGRIFITAETQRISFAHAEKFQTVSGDDDKDLEAKAANNYPLANDRVLVRFEGDVINGLCTIALSSALPPMTAVLRAYATGTNDAGAITDAIGAVRLLPAEPAAP